MKKITVLGVTGSIGTQTIDVVKNHSDEFEIVAMSAGRNIQLLEEIMQSMNVKHICVQNKEDKEYLEGKYPDCQFYDGQDGLIAIATLTEVDIVLNAIVGFAGLLPTMEAIKAHKDIALANKETLVVAGHLIIPLVKEYGVALLPVDSEHSAIFQSMNGEHHGDIAKIILTASGGSFRDKSRDELKDVTVEQALKHPNWSMGAKITIDSATLFNKGLEVMEAKWLFDVDYDDIDVLIHPESIIHSMVEYQDTSVIAQLGTPDMRLPIQYALTYPYRQPLIGGKRLSLADIGSLHFYRPDFKRYHALELAYEAGRMGGSMPCVLNGANEQANALFLERKIHFLDIERLVEEAMRAHQFIAYPTLEQLLEIDQWARHFVLKRVGED
ncbi:1-deoxy-D-xylulose-5-phosphate reductoisomerase [Candidatus Stoquefichus massiliensis]|uniref:1-deoxy-D-xylulose-5-phosphate reductoisomerase n=1 Tax=Candidatus Stoquefichus massiliensis TaxID=1470350 RepID=UPI00048298A4|nr:1-deoxy-D-xylulose-5-phosphate reductoisomerase [Candidatus Stoquefichus massiliensis]